MTDVATTPNAEDQSKLSVVAPDSPTALHTSSNSGSPKPRANVRADLDAARESYFAAVVGRSPMPPKQSYVPLTPRRGVVARASTTGDPIIDGNNANQQHKGRAIDSVDMLLATSNGFLSTINNVSERLVQHLQKSYDQTSTFQNEFKWVTPKGYGLADVTNKAELKLTAEIVADRWLKRPRHAPQSIITPLLDQISAPTAGNGDEANKPSKLSRTSLLDATEVFRGVDPHVNTKIPLKDSHYKALPKPTLSEVLIAQHNFLHVDVKNQGKEELARTEADRQRFSKQAAMFQSEVDAFLGQRKYADAEGSLKKLLTAQAQWVEIMVKRIAALNMNNTDASEFAKEKDQLLKDADELLIKYRKDKEGAVNEVAFDLRRCAELRQKTDIQNTDADELFNKNESDINARLKLNEKHHLEMLTEITERAKILEKLSEDRRQMILSHIRAREDRDREVFQNNELKERVSEFELLLNQVKNYLGEEIVLCDTLDAHNQKMNKWLNERILDGDIDDIRFEELKELKRVYGDFVFNSGSLVAKKNHRFDTLERQIRLAQLQKDTAKSSLDPHVAQHESELVDLSKLLKETEAAIMSLEAQHDTIASLTAEPLALLEEQCKARGLEYVHPAAISIEKVVADRKAFVDRTQQFVNEEFDVVAKRKEQLQRLRSAKELEEEQHAANMGVIDANVRKAAGSPTAIVNSSTPQKQSTSSSQ